ncbi:MAG: isochorismatase family protein [Dehalococcoidia bacterium]
MADNKGYRHPGMGGVKIGFGKRPALIVIDMQHDFVDPDAPVTCAPMAQRAVPHISRLLEGARRAGVPIFYTQGLARPDLSDVGLWKSKARREGRVQVEGTRGADIIEELAPQEGDIVIQKRRPSAFFKTELDVLLRAFKIDTFIVTGASMSGCVRATIVDAFSHDIRVIVPRQCVVDRMEAVLEANLADVDAKYADVIDVHEVLSYLEELGPRITARAK